MSTNEFSLEERSGTILYRPRATTSTEVIVERAAARADAFGKNVIVKVPGTLGAGLYSAVKPGESPQHRAHQADTIEAMRPRRN